MEGGGGVIDGASAWNIHGKLDMFVVRLIVFAIDL